jgi:hypothetical protein
MCTHTHTHTQPRTHKKERKKETKGKGKEVAYKSKLRNDQFWPSHRTFVCGYLVEQPALA